MPVSLIPAISKKAKKGNNPVVAAWGEEVPLLNTASKP
jgi:hypothetical protein